MLCCETFSLVSFSANVAPVNAPLLVIPSMVIFAFSAQFSLIHQPANIDHPRS